jgi:NAD(P)-dependent dehydrogenase (short-subunit alcohol dehydrogenase family)
MSPKSKAVCRAVLITGASTGIGEACALELDRLGFRVFAGVRSEAAGRAIQAKASSRLLPILLDVTDSESIAAAAEIVEKAVGEAGLAGLVNNAGIAVPGPIEALPIAALRNQLEVNVVGAVAVTQALLPLIRKAQGRIVNMSSLNGALASPFLGAYSASKFALEAVSDALRLELNPWNIHVALVEPGPIATPIWEKTAATAEQISAAASPAVSALYERNVAAMNRAVARLVRSALPVDSVVQTVVHALTAPRPKVRYFLTWGVRFMSKGFRMAPERLQDWIIRKALGLS